MTASNTSPASVTLKDAQCIMGDGGMANIQYAVWWNDKTGEYIGEWLSPEAEKRREELKDWVCPECGLTA